MAIHSARGFSSAADILGRSQPAISRRIALLEQELGITLFERATGGVVLSEAGRTLLPHAERVHAALRDAANAMEALRTETAGAVSIVAVGTLAGALAAYLIAGTFKARMAYAIGVLFLCGGIAASFMIAAPAWFIALDLIAAYLPMAWLATRIGARLQPPTSA